MELNPTKAESSFTLLPLYLSAPDTRTAAATSNGHQARPANDRSATPPAGSQARCGRSRAVALARVVRYALRWSASDSSAVRSRFTSWCWCRPSAAPAATSCQTRPQTLPLWAFLPALQGGRSLPAPSAILSDHVHPRLRFFVIWGRSFGIEIIESSLFEILVRSPLPNFRGSYPR